MWVGRRVSGCRRELFPNAPIGDVFETFGRGMQVIRRQVQKLLQITLPQTVRSNQLPGFLAPGRRQPELRALGYDLSPAA